LKRWNLNLDLKQQNPKAGAMELEAMELEAMEHEPQATEPKGRSNEA
jgi:hypothetical protein